MNILNSMSKDMARKKNHIKENKLDNIGFISCILTPNKSINIYLRNSASKININ